MTNTTTCGECGAKQTPGISCLDCFHALLAFENEHPPAFGAVHHLTVACFYLQHPSGYAREVLKMWEDLLGETLDRPGSLRHMMRQASQRFAGSARVRESGAPPPSGWPTTWPMTVTSVLRPDENVSVEVYVERAMSWARQTRARLSERRAPLPRQ